MTLYAVFVLAYQDTHMQGEPGPPVTLLGVFTTNERAKETIGYNPLAWIEAVTADTVVSRRVSS